MLSTFSGLRLFVPQVRAPRYLLTRCLGETVGGREVGQRGALGRDEAAGKRERGPTHFSEEPGTGVIVLAGRLALEGKPHSFGFWLRFLSLQVESRAGRF